MKYKLKLCPLARQHHAESARQFAHVFHRSNTICITPEFHDLPQSYRLGILLHELGHIAMTYKTKPHSEAEADAMIEIISGVHIHRRTYRGLKRLECVERAQMSKAGQFIAENIQARLRY